MIYLGADHRGFQLKETLKEFLLEKGVECMDMGAHSLEEGDDYADFAERVSQKVSEKPCENKGILTCGSGHGMDMVANKFPAVRAALCLSRERAVQSREHEDANMLVLPADDIDESLAKDMVDTWLSTPFSKAERHRRRLKKIKDIEIKNFDMRTHFECDD